MTTAAGDVGRRVGEQRRDARWCDVAAVRAGVARGLYYAPPTLAQQVAGGRVMRQGCRVGRFSGGNRVSGVRSIKIVV